MPWDYCRTGSGYKCMYISEQRDPCRSKLHQLPSVAEDNLSSQYLTEKKQSFLCWCCETSLGLGHILTRFWGTEISAL